MTVPKAASCRDCLASGHADSQPGVTRDRGDLVCILHAYWREAGQRPGGVDEGGILAMSQALGEQARAEQVLLPYCRRCLVGVPGALVTAAVTEDAGDSVCAGHVLSRSA